MHRSRLSAITIDCSEDSFDEGTRFWREALGMATRQSRGQDSTYADFDGTVGGLEIGTQRVGAASRVHLDIEADDVEAEVQRLEALGARRKEFIEHWWVMMDPSGQLFCVVPWRERDETPQWHEWP